VSDSQGTLSIALPQQQRKGWVMGTPMKGSLEIFISHKHSGFTHL